MMCIKEKHAKAMGKILYGKHDDFFFLIILYIAI